MCMMSCDVCARTRARPRACTTAAARAVGVEGREVDIAVGVRSSTTRGDGAVADGGAAQASGDEVKARGVQQQHVLKEKVRGVLN